MFKKTFIIGAAVVLGALGFVSSVNADHAWGGYHWARTANPFTIKIGNNLSPNWSTPLQVATSDWSISDVLDAQIVSGGTNPKNCKAVIGRVEVCNSKYGNNGWLGIASVWVSGTHITQGTVKVNDTYFNTPKYNTPAWRNLVLCQEIGHAFGLDHQDENFANAPLGTCMDYSNDPIPNQHPNQHDFEELNLIYSHLDTSTTVSSSPSSNRHEVDHSDPSSWGKQIRTSSDGRGTLYLKDFGNGDKVFTFIVPANED